VAVEENVRPATDVDDKTADLALALFDPLDHQINRTDAKAQLVLAADAILLDLFSMQNPTTVQAFLVGHAAVVRAPALLIVLVFVGLFLTLTSGLVVIWPRSGASGHSTLVYLEASLAAASRTLWLPSCVSRARR
jgi:hypothetical protein